MYGLKSPKATNGDGCLYYNRPSQGNVPGEARIERFSTIKALLSCKLTASSSVAPHVLKMKGYLEDLERLGLNIE